MNKVETMYIGLSELAADGKLISYNNKKSTSGGKITYIKFN